MIKKYPVQYFFKYRGFMQYIYFLNNGSCFLRKKNTRILRTRLDYQSCPKTFKKNREVSKN